MIRRLIVTLLAVLALVPVFAFAAEEAGAPPVQASLVALISAIGAAIIPWVTWGIALLIPKIPRALLPFLPVGLGWVTSYLASLSSGHTSPLVAAVVALTALVLREVIHSLTQHGLGGGGGEVIGEPGKQAFIRREW